MQRFFLTEADTRTSEGIVIRNAETYAHMHRVLRMGVGDMVELVASDGAFEATLSAISSSEIHLTEGAPLSVNSEPGVNLHVFQSIPKGQKLDWIVQKGVEVGVDGFTLVASKRCVATYAGKDAAKKCVRFNRIAAEAAAQSKRLHIPEVTGVMSLEAVAKAVESFDVFLVLYEGTCATRLGQFLKHRAHEIKRVGLCIGPEGGFDPDEIEMLEAAGALTVSLGPRILRTETAALVAATCVFYACGEMD